MALAVANGLQAGVGLPMSRGNSAAGAE